MTKEERYRKVAMELLKMYMESETTVIGEYSGDFKRSAEWLEKEVKKYLKKLDYEENKFEELANGNWLYEDWGAEQ